MRSRRCTTVFTWTWSRVFVRVRLALGEVDVQGGDEVGGARPVVVEHGAQRPAHVPAQVGLVAEEYADEAQVRDGPGRGSGRPVGAGRLALWRGPPRRR
ncbi:hypothetical protein SMICM304S_10299 [Streptomyces microflavus]